MHQQRLTVENFIPLCASSLVFYQSPNPACHLWLSHWFGSYMSAKRFMQTQHSMRMENVLCASLIKPNKNQATDKMRKKRQTSAHPYTAHWWDGVFACLNWAKISRREYKRNDDFILACLLSPLMSRVLPHSIFHFQSLWIWTLASDVYKEKSVGRMKVGVSLNWKKATPRELLMYELHIDDTHVLIWSLSSHITSHL